MIRQVQSQNMSEILRHHLQAQTVGQTVGMQGNNCAGGDTAHTDHEPQAEDADAVVQGGIGPAAGGLGEQVDGAAEKDGFNERHCRQGQVGQGQGDGQPFHRLEQHQGSMIDLEGF